MSDEEINREVRKSLEEERKKSELIRKREEERSRQIGLIGIMILIIGIILMLSAIITASTDRWSTPTGLTLIIIGVIFISLSISILTKGK